MDKEEIDKLFKRIESDKSFDSCGFEFADGFSCTFDNIATCYDDRLKLYELVKKQKEVINKIFSRITLWKMEDITGETNKVLDDLLDILKEV